jgi:nucleoside-diphosphate-sugar epimerase
MRALVTGGAGFIGHHLVRRLLDDGWEVAVLDDLSTGDVRRLTSVMDRIDFVEGDIRDAAAVDRAVRGADVVFHEAALPSVARSVVDPRLTNDVNTNGTIEVMLGSSRAGVRRVVFAASSSVYGVTPELPRRETQRPDPQSPYAASKVACEYYLHSLGALHGIETVALRYFNIFGPGQDPASEYAAVIPRFVVAALAGGQPIVNGDGTQSRDFTYIENVVAANMAAATTPGVTGLTCNIGCGSRYTLLDLLDRIGEAAGVRISPQFAPARAGDVPHSQADITLAATTLGYRPTVDFAEGIRRTVEWYRSTADQAPDRGAGEADPAQRSA